MAVCSRTLGCFAQGLSLVWLTLILLMAPDAMNGALAQLATQLLGQEIRIGVGVASGPVIAHSAQRRAEAQGLKDYLFTNVYRHARVVAVMADAERVVRDLFGRYMSDPGELPGPWRAMTDRDGQAGRAAVVADFVAGMTDRFALKEHRRLFDATPDLR